MGAGALESPDVGEHARYLRWPRGTSRKFFAALWSKGFTTRKSFFSTWNRIFDVIFQKKCYFFHVWFIKKGVWCPTTMRVGAFESLDVGEHSRYIGWLRVTSRKVFRGHMKSLCHPEIVTFWAFLTMKTEISSRFLKNRYFLTFASLKKDYDVVRPWELVRLKALM